MTDTHEKITPSSGCVFADLGVERPDYLDQAREAVENGRQEAMADGLFVGTVRSLGLIEVYVAQAISQAHQDGIREGKRQAAEIAQAKADGVRACMLRYFEGGHCIDFQRYQEGCEAVAADILSTITDESE